uniref:Cyclin-like domain-containing protein n=1 Tax=Rhodosorus marinus TaxID=101924 RepID=A0A7S0BKQ3_9RHOD|mmetsp:Transcript_19537/g.28394  ORF Transcript_19537/g.28394 Transcript_19537/m.28394 type:complete len:195 (+) Transcript_19537:193-777(+)
MDGVKNVLAGVITARVIYNDEYAPLRDARNFIAYHSKTLPPISPADYLRRIANYGGFSPSVLLLGLYYIDRLALHDQRFLVTSFNVNRLLITAIMLACKYLEDLKFSLHHFAVIGGVSARELQELEVDMLMRLQFSLAVAPDELNAYRRRLADEFLHLDCNNFDCRGKCTAVPRKSNPQQEFRPLQPLLPPHRV